MAGTELRLVALLLAAMTAIAGMPATPFVDLDQDALLVLVNRDNKLPHTYVPDTLVLPDVAAAPGKEEAIYLRPEAAQALERLFGEAAAAGHALYAVSGYRSYATQKAIFQRKVDAVGEKRAMLTVAPAGASEHQLGLAMDINGHTTVRQGLVQAFGETPEGQWVYENAHHFGFIIRYPQGKTDITGYAWEPWHLRYVGVEAATQVKTLGLTFEEYHDTLQALRGLANGDNAGAADEEP